MAPGVPPTVVIHGFLRVSDGVLATRGDPTDPWVCLDERKGEDERGI